ncbi:LysR family transcriptional regulator [Paracoccus onubensis]|uniref:LysR family transcriptional regulator n=2 Tax=Paracoccus onubensis TaxID=1675788 RepID=A0A418T873_9RHOB|nr:LysR family transcriptional regulator [Paracoccus onubensis]
MEIKWLEDFVSLVDTSSFSRAAEQRNVTQPAFSRRIKQLETWLGTILISRATLPPELTLAGQQFLPVARETIRTYYGLRETLGPSAGPGLIRFAALHTLTVTVFPEWLGKLQTEGRSFPTSLLPDRGGIEANLDALVADEADFFLTYAHPIVPFHLDRSRFPYLTIAGDRLIPLAAPLLHTDTGTLPGKGILDRAVTSGIQIPYLSYGLNSFFGIALLRLLAQRASFRKRVTHENTISAGLMSMAISGAGLCWLPERLVHEDMRAGRLVPASDDSRWTLDLDVRLYRHSGNRVGAVEALWRAASERAGQPPVTPS